MLRVFIFGFAVVVVFTGMVTVLPILEGSDVPRQVAAVAARPALLPSCIISAHPQTVSAWEEASIAWGSENASSASLSAVGEVPLQGGTFVMLAESSTFTLTVRSHTGDEATCSTEVLVSTTEI